MRDTTDAAELYRALLVSRRLSQLRRLTYRCSSPARCLLLDAVETPLGVLMHQRRFKFSPGENAALSNEAGRANNTYDGDNHWRERTYYLKESALAHPEDGDGPHLGVSCDHVLDYHLKATEFDTDWRAGHAEVRVQPNGTRYAVA